jgi:hypothetical protein
MRTIRNAASIAALLIALGPAAAGATDEPPTFANSGKGKAYVKTGSFAKFNMRAARSTSFDLPDVPDNDPTVEGGSLAFYEIDNPTNRVDFPLPAPGWSSFGPGRGFRYRGTGLSGDPCTTVVVKAKGVKAVCRGSDVTLTPPLASFFLGVTVTVGSSSKQYCPGYYALTNLAGVLKGVPAIIESERLCSPSGAFLDAD